MRTEMDTLVLEDCILTQARPARVRRRPATGKSTSSSIDQDSGIAEEDAAVDEQVNFVPTRPGVLEARELRGWRRVRCPRPGARRAGRARRRAPGRVRTRTRGRGDTRVSIPSCSSASAIPAPIQADPASRRPGSPPRRRPAGSSSRTFVGQRLRPTGDPGASGLPARGGVDRVHDRHHHERGGHDAERDAAHPWIVARRRVCHHRTTDQPMASQASIPSAHVQMTRYGKISPTMRLHRHDRDDDRRARAARRTGTPSLARRHVSAAAPTSTSATDRDRRRRHSGRPHRCRCCATTLAAHPVGPCAELRRHHVPRVAVAVLATVITEEAHERAEVAGLAR